MPRSIATIEKIKEQRREQILKQSLRLFAINGYDATSINDISAACGCSHGLVYHYYKDKETIFTTLLDQALALGFMPIFPQLEERHLQDPVGTMRQVIGHIFDELNKPDSSFGYYFYLFLNMRFQKTAPLPRFQVPQRELRPFGIITTIIGAGQDRGLFAQGEKRDIAILFFATMRGLTYAKLNEQGNYALPSIDALMNLFLRKAA